MPPERRYLHETDADVVPFDGTIPHSVQDGPLAAAQSAELNVDPTKID